MNKKLSTKDIKSLWYFHENEQLEEELTENEREQINRYIKDHPGEDMWEI